MSSIQTPHGLRPEQILEAASGTADSDSGGSKPKLKQRQQQKVIIVEVCVCVYYIYTLSSKPLVPGGRGVRRHRAATAETAGGSSLLRAAVPSGLLLLDRFLALLLQALAPGGRMELNQRPPLTCINRFRDMKNGRIYALYWTNPGRFKPTKELICSC